MQYLYVVLAAIVGGFVLLVYRGAKPNRFDKEARNYLAEEVEAEAADAEAVDTNACAFTETPDPPQVDLVLSQRLMQGGDSGDDQEPQVTASTAANPAVQSETQPGAPTAQQVTPADLDDLVMPPADDELFAEDGIEAASQPDEMQLQPEMAALSTDAGESPMSQVEPKQRELVFASGALQVSRFDRTHQYGPRGAVRDHDGKVLKKPQPRLAFLFDQNVLRQAALEGRVGQKLQMLERIAALPIQTPPPAQVAAEVHSTAAFAAASPPPAKASNTAAAAVSSAPAAETPYPPVVAASTQEASVAVSAAPPRRPAPKSFSSMLGTVNDRPAGTLSKPLSLPKGVERKAGVSASSAKATPPSGTATSM